LGIGAIGDYNGGVIIDLPHFDTEHGWRRFIPDLGNTRLTCAAKGGGMATFGMGFYRGEGFELGVNAEPSDTGVSIDFIGHVEAGVFPEGVGFNLTGNTEIAHVYPASPTTEWWNLNNLGASIDISPKPGVGEGIWDGIGAGFQVKYNTPTLSTIIAALSAISNVVRWVH
jgi:hypothetical protein